jgi:hypothetical protein
MANLEGLDDLLQKVDVADPLNMEVLQQAVLWAGRVE